MTAPRRCARCAAAVAVLALAACATEHRPSRRVPPAEERDILRRQQRVNSVGAEFPLLWDAEVLDVLRRAGGDIALAIGAPEDGFHYYVIDKPVLNAFTSPTGDIFFFTGQLAAMRTTQRAGRRPRPRDRPRPGRALRADLAQRLARHDPGARGDHPLGRQPRGLRRRARAARVLPAGVLAGDGGGGRPPLDDLPAPDLVRPARAARRAAADRGRGALPALRRARVAAHAPAHRRRGSARCRTASACRPARSTGRLPTRPGTGSARSSSRSTSRSGRCASSASGPARAAAPRPGPARRGPGAPRRPRPRPPHIPPGRRRGARGGPLRDRPGHGALGARGRPRRARRARARAAAARAGPPLVRALRPRGDRPLRGPGRRGARALRAAPPSSAPPLAEAHYQLALALSGTARLGEADLPLRPGGGAARGLRRGARAATAAPASGFGADPIWAARIDAALAHME